jgi:hypothetical protein
LRPVAKTFKRLAAERGLAIPLTTLTLRDGKIVKEEVPGAARRHRRRNACA